MNGINICTMKMEVIAVNSMKMSMIKIILKMGVCDERAEDGTQDVTLTLLPLFEKFLHFFDNWDQAYSVNEMT